MLFREIFGYRSSKSDVGHLHAVAYEIKKPQKTDNNKLQEVKEKFQNWMLEAFPGIHFSCNKMSVTYIG